MKKAKGDYSGIIENAYSKDLFNGTLTCLLSSFGVDGIEGNEKLVVLKKILAIGIKRKFDVNACINLSLEVMSELYDKDFMTKVVEALKLATHKEAADAPKEQGNGDKV